MAQKPDGKPARTERVTFTRPAAEVARDLQVRALTVDELLESPDVDAVAICTPSESHVDLIVRAAEAGKAVFC